MAHVLKIIVNMRKLKILSWTALAVAAWNAPSFAGACTGFVQLTPINQRVSTDEIVSKVSFGNFALTLKDPWVGSGAVRTKAGWVSNKWNGPIAVRNVSTNSVCKIDDGSSILKLYGIEGSDRILVFKINRQVDWAEVYDLLSCKSLWKEDGTSGYKLQTRTAFIRIPDCRGCPVEPQSEEVQCQCRSARYWELAPNCYFKLNNELTLKKTEENLKMSFIDKKDMTVLAGQVVKWNLMER